jgi:hypothetical protein
VPIPFPKMHVAQSVLNRIMNAMEEMEPPPMAAVQPEGPIIDDPALTGDTLDQSLEQPLAPTAGADELQQDGMLAESVAGGSPLAGAIGATAF